MSRFRSDPLNALQHEINRLVEQYWPAWAPNLPFATAEERAQAAWVPAVDVYETHDEVVVEADIPGVSADAVQVTIEGRVLTLRGEKPGAPASESPAHPLRERRFGPFVRHVPLPAEVDLNAVQAQAKSGVLKIRLAKVEAARVRQVPIQPA